jgi:hypothetical protein
LRALRREVEDRAVLEVDQPGHIGVENGVEGRTPHETCDHALAADGEPHLIGWKIPRDRRAVPQLESELQIQRLVRLGQQIPENLQTHSLVQPVLPFWARLSGGCGGNNLS